MTLAGGWRVTERLARKPGHTGGFFSVSYRVIGPDGAPAFLKALDIEAALQQAHDIPLALQVMTQAYLFEVNVLEMTGARRLSRVVQSRGHGEVQAQGPRGVERVNYLVFEIADGDVRDALDAAEQLDDAWKLRMLHHAATGTRQLHDNGVAHQDLKPSNVLVFGGIASKVADLGCASVQGTASPRDNEEIAGDWTYAPPELLYGELSSDWRVRRFACDLYQLGSLAVFLFTGQNVTSLLMSCLAKEHRPGQWGDGYLEVLPFIRAAYDEVMEEFAASCPTSVRDELVQRVRELCDPDVALRGHPLNRAGRGNPYSLERYVASFDLLAGKVEVHLRATRP